MIDFLDMDNNKMVISEFYENDQAGKYEYSATYQRDKVWSAEKKSFLIDSILKNYPIPPIFLRLKINPDTGLSSYDVIDGKQRLTSIRDFIDGKIALPDDFGDDIVGNSELNGAYFSDLDKYAKYKKQFWRYRIPIIFIETEDSRLVKNVFDRLNRNGVPLVPQELRHAQYGDSTFYKKVENLTNVCCWKDVFEAVLETDRMEHQEFTSELLFLITEEKINDYTKATLDDLYKKWENQRIEIYEQKFQKVSDYVSEFSLDYEKLKIQKVSHLYAIWALGVLGYEQNINSKELGEILNNFYVQYMSEKEKNDELKEYKVSMSANTKSRSSRKKRLDALIKFCSKNGVVIENKL